MKRWFGISLGKGTGNRFTQQFPYTGTINSRWWKGYPPNFLIYCGASASKHVLFGGSISYWTWDYCFEKAPIYAPIVYEKTDFAEIERMFRIPWFGWRLK